MLFIVAPIVCGGYVLGPCFVIQYFVSFLFCNHLDGEEKAGCFTLTVFLVTCDSQCFVALPHGAVGSSAVCDCCITLSYSLAFYTVTCFGNVFLLQTLNKYTT